MSEKEGVYTYIVGTLEDANPYYVAGPGCLVSDRKYAKNYAGYNWLARKLHLIAARIRFGDETLHFENFIELRANIAQKTDFARGKR